MEFIKCQQCDSYLIKRPPSMTTDATEKYYCPQCQQSYQLINGNTGTALNPDKYLVKINY